MRMHGPYMHDLLRILYIASRNVNVSNMFDGARTNELADLLHVDHEQVLRDVHDLLGRVRKSDLAKFEAFYPDAEGHMQRCLRLPANEAWILMTGYKPELFRFILHDIERLGGREAIDKLYDEMSGRKPEAL